MPPEHGANLGRSRSPLLSQGKPPPPCREKLAEPPQPSNKSALPGAAQVLHGTQRQASITDSFTKTQRKHAATRDLTSLPAAKRMKTAMAPAGVKTHHGLGFIFRDNTASIKAHAEGVHSFEPRTGAKKLIIKNLRTTPRKDPSIYYNKLWAELDAALTSIFEDEPPALPLERLYRGAEDLCRAGRAEELFQHLRQRCHDYLTQKVFSSISVGPGINEVETLRSIHSYWKLWSRQSHLLRSIFSHVDSSYLMNSREHPRLNDLAIALFYQMVFDKKGADGVDRGERMLAGMCALVDYDRKGEHELFDSTLLKESVSMLHIFGVYDATFEPGLLQGSKQYFEEWAEARSSLSLPDYITACAALVNREGLRCDQYNFDTSTKVELIKLAQHHVVEQRLSILLDPAGIAKLLEAGSIPSLRDLYALLRAAQHHEDLRLPWGTYIKTAGATIVSDKERGDDMVLRLLQLKRSQDMIVRDCFNRDARFTKALRESFGEFINDRKNTAVWGTSTSKVGEMVAKHIDLLLRGGVKAIPPSLITDAVDRETSQRLGQSSTGDEDAELDRQLDLGLELFRFIEGKDVFEAFYKKDLARRLLMGRSASQDAERNMLTKLKTECGSSFTHNLEQMFKDQELARDEMTSFKQMLLNTLRDEGRDKPDLDLQVNVLSAAAWPTYPDTAVTLPPDVARYIAKYEAHYASKHTGRKLTWKHSLGHCVLRARFAKGVKELVVSAFQAIVLLQFNDVPGTATLDYPTLARATGLSDADLQRTLQSLACGKARVLTKQPKGRDVAPTDVFAFHAAFAAPQFRIKINAIQLKETVEEVADTHARVAHDRQYETQAAIVRIMKTRKALAHAALVAEVIAQTKSRGAVEPAEIKKNIEKLIEKDYIEREGGLYVYVA